MAIEDVIEILDDSDDEELAGPPGGLGVDTTAGGAEGPHHRHRGGGAQPAETNEPELATLSDHSDRCVDGATQGSQEERPSGPGGPALATESNDNKSCGNEVMEEDQPSGPGPALANSQEGEAPSPSPERTHVSPADVSLRLNCRNCRALIHVPRSLMPQLVASGGCFKCPSCQDVQLANMPPVEGQAAPQAAFEPAAQSAPHPAAESASQPPPLVSAQAPSTQQQSPEKAASPDSTDSDDEDFGHRLVIRRPPPSLAFQAASELESPSVLPEKRDNTMGDTEGSSESACTTQPLSLFGGQHSQLPETGPETQSASSSALQEHIASPSSSATPTPAQEEMLLDRSGSNDGENQLDEEGSAPATEAPGQSYIGRRVAKMFPGHSQLPFKGVVTGSRPPDPDEKHGEDWYTVEYQDGDTEDVYAQELEKIMLPADSAAKSKWCVCEDISQGKEALKIPVFNEVDGDDMMPCFEYVKESVLGSTQGIDLVRHSSADAHKRLYFGKDNKLSEAKDIYDCTSEGDLRLNICQEPLGVNECGAAEELRLVARGISKPLEVFKSRGKGWGLRCRDTIHEGEFVCEYAGEFQTDEAAEAQKNQPDHDEYFFSLDHFHLVYEGIRKKLVNIKENYPVTEEPPIINGREMGNVGRFINHAKRDLANLAPVSVLTEANHSVLYYRIAFFAITTIEAGTELTYDYGDNYKPNGKHPDWHKGTAKRKCGTEAGRVPRPAKRKLSKVAQGTAKS